MYLRDKKVNPWKKWINTMYLIGAPRFKVSQGMERGKPQRKINKINKNDSPQKILEPTKTQGTFNEKFSGYKIIEDPSF